jgi:hypothetical protein
VLLAFGCQPSGGNQAPVSSEVGAGTTAGTQLVSDETLPSLPVRRANYAITKLHFDRAARILENEVGPRAALTRARLAVYRADCEGALSQLASEAVRKLPEAEELLQLAPRCAGATAEAVIIDNAEAGVWIRVQDDADAVLVPMITEVAEQARATLELDLGESLPRPLRIDLVRDLFSLSAVSGLPLEAAETTGTVAVARWGRITMVSPRAMTHGFPWADTLAHEITHLLISRATADRAPLWLQEGIAKREEHRWRPAQAFDEKDEPSLEAYRAQKRGRGIGVDKIGPSIAMLPSAEDASIAFAEVTSFMEYWIEKNGPFSLGLLLRDLEVAEDSDAAMRSVSGYDVRDWQLQWRADLQRRFFEASTSEPEMGIADLVGARRLAQILRATELLTVDGQVGAAANYSSTNLDSAPHVAAFRFLAARATLVAAEGNFDTVLGELSQMDAAQAGWLALSYLRGAQDQSPSRAPILQAQRLDPLLPEAACDGLPWVGPELTSESSVALLPEGPENRQLCDHARSLPLRGSR